MDSIKNTNAVNDDDDNECKTEEQQSQSSGVDSGARPSLSQVKKSWGFRRTTIAQREFMEEVGDLTHSPPLVRRNRSRRSNQAPEINTEDGNKQKTTRTARSVIEDLQWSAPSSPVSEDNKDPSETSAGGTFDPSSWQDFGSAFHTAFSLLGGNEGLSLTDALAVPGFFEPANEIEPTDPEPVEEHEAPNNLDDMEVTQPVTHDNVTEKESDFVVLISSQEEDSDEMTLSKIKEQLATRNRQGDSKARGGKGGRGKARGRGRSKGKGRGKGKGKGRGRGKAVELQSIVADNEDTDDDVVLVNTDELQNLHEENMQNDQQSSPEMESTSSHFGITLNAALESVSSDCIILDSDFNQSSAVTHDKFDDAPDEVEGEKGKKQGENIGEIPSITESEEHDCNTMCFVCSQIHNKRFMICCNSCQEWFHTACVGISERQDWKIEEKDQDYMCLTCTTTRQTIIHLESHLEEELSFPECLTLSPLEEGSEQQEEQHQQQVLKEAVVVEEKEEEREAPATTPDPTAEGEPEAKPEPQCEMETDGSFPLCTGPGCAKQALPDSVYCGTDCILQHAAITMKTLTCPEEPKSKERPQRKAAATRPFATAQSSCRTSKRLAKKALDEAQEVEMKKDHSEREEPSASPKTCDPSLTDVQSTSIPSSNLNTTSEEANGNPETDKETRSPSKQCLEETSTDAPLQSKLVTEELPLQNASEDKKSESVSNEQKVAEDASATPTSEKSDHPPAIHAPPILTIRHHEMGALIVKKTTYVIPKKQSISQSPCSQSSQKAASVPNLMNETRNLLVPPAPSAPSSRPSQPNNQVRQSIQRSLTTILFKRVSDCEDLEMPESEVVKLVAGIEKEMFDIFRNTDSKYMNKYRTIMFNLKDPKNKGLLYRVVNGEIGPFRLVRMTQKDMQATKAPEPTTKKTSQVEVEAVKGTNIPKPEAVKIDLPSLNPVRPERKAENMEQKKVPPTQPSKARVSQPSKNKKMPDILSCMLKDTTSEHKAHLFDLKCKICTGQIQAVEEEEPAKKKSKVSTSRDKTGPSWKKPVGDESPLLAQPETPELDSPTYSLIEPSSQTDIDSPKLTIVESPASPVMDSPASSTLESPASPVMESPASPTPDSSTMPAPKRSYTPVVIPTVSTVTISRRDPRTAANRFPASLDGNSSLSNTTTKQAVPYAALKSTPTSTSTPPSSVPPPKALPKSILMKPSSSADPRLYGASSRAAVSQTPADGDSAPFLAKQGILWKGFLNMLTVAKFMTKAYLVSGPAENLKSDLPDTIQIGGRILPETVWDYVEKLKTSVTKELCVIRFYPATDEEEVAYVSLFSYFSSRGRFGVVANISRSIKDVYLVPLGANESIPSILQPFIGPGLEKNRPNLLLGLAIVQKLKRPGSLPQEIEEKKLKVNMSKDPMWIPKPPVLYGSDKLDIFKPYDPETAASSSPPDSPSCIGSPSDSLSSGSVPTPSLLSSIGATPVSSIAATELPSVTGSGKNFTQSTSSKTPLQTILKTLFGGKESDQTDSSDVNSSKTAENVKKKSLFSKVSGSMVDPIVQQYGQKSKVKPVKEEEKEDDFDRPYDPEEEYDPAKEYKIFPPQITDNKTDDSTLIGLVEDDVAYDPEDETIFEVFQSEAAVSKLPIPTQSADTSSFPTSISDSTPTTPQSNPASVMSNLPTGAVVVSAATLSEQQRMLEELNKQIEEQKRQLKEQEEALRQQREAVGMFMAHFSVSDTLLSPPTKALPLNQLPVVQCGEISTESKPAEKPDKVNNNTGMKNNSVAKPDTVQLEQTTVSDNLKAPTNSLTKQMTEQENVKELEKYSSAGEIEDSDVAYDPEDESLFDEIQDDVFKGGSTKTSDASLRTGDSVENKTASPNSHHSRKRRSSPRRRSRRERDHRSPSRRSQRRSRSHSRRHRDKDRHRRIERDRLRHRTRDTSEYLGHHRKDYPTSRHSHGRRMSSSSPRRKHSASLSPKRHMAPPSQLADKTKQRSGQCLSPETVRTTKASQSPSAIRIKSEPGEHNLECNVLENPVKDLLEIMQNVKTEISEPSNNRQNDNQTGSTSSQENKASLQDTWFQDKFESKIPLREIDPPLRDSPESPDPEPQFSKPSSTENIDCARTDVPTGLNIQGTGPERDAVMHNILLGGSVQDTEHPAQDITDPEPRITHTDQMEEGIDLKRSDLKGLERQHVITNILNASNIQNTPIDSQGTCLMQQARCFQGSMLNLTKDPNTNKCGSQTVPGSSEIRAQVQGTESSSFQVINQDVMRSCPDVTQTSTPYQFIRNQLSDGRDSISSMVHYGPSTSEHVDKAEQGCYGEALSFLKTNESRSQPENPDSNSSIMKIETPFEGAHFDGRISHPGTLGSHIGIGDETGQGASFIGFRGDRTHSKHAESLYFEERGPGRSKPQSFGERDFSCGKGNVDRPDILNLGCRGSGSSQISQLKSICPPERNIGSNAQSSEYRGAQKGLNKEVRDPVRAGPFTQNEWTAHQFGKRGSNLESQGPYKVGPQIFEYGQRIKEVIPNREKFMHDVRGPRGPDLMGARTEIRNPELQFPENNTQQPVHSGMMEKGLEQIGPDIAVTLHDRREPVDSDFGRQGPEWIVPKSVNPVHNNRGPDRVEIIGQKRGWPERREAHPNSPGIDKRGPNIDDPGNVWRGSGGPKFRGGPENRGSSMQGPEQHSKGCENLGFRGPGHNREGFFIENTGSQSRGGEGPVFSDPDPKGRSSLIEKFEPDRISEHPNFSQQRSDRGTMVAGPKNDRRNARGPDFSRPVNEKRGPDRDSQHFDRAGSRGPENWGPGPERKGTYFGGSRADSIEQRQETIFPDFKGPNTSCGQRGPYFRGNVTEGTCPKLEGSEHRRRDLNLRGQGSDIAGSLLNRTGPGSPRTRRGGPQDEGPNMKRANGRSPPRGSQFTCFELGRPSSDMEGVQPDRNVADLEDVENNRIAMEGMHTVAMGPKFCRRPGNESRGPDYECLGPDRQNPRGPSFREPVPVRPCPGMDSRKPDWRESSDLDIRGHGTREERANTEGLTYERLNEWVESEAAQEFPDYENLYSDRRGGNFRPSRLLRRNVRRPGPNPSGSAPSQRGSAFEGKWSDSRGPRFEEFGRGGSSGDIWDNSGDRGLETFQDHPDEDGEGLHRRENYREWIDRQDTENMQFSVSGDDWDGSDWRAPGHVQNNTDMDCSVPNREGEEHEWTEPDREGSGGFFRGRGGTCNRRQIRGRGRGRGSAMQTHVNMEDDWRQQDFKGDMRGHDDEIAWAHGEGFSLKNSHPNRGPFKMEAQGGPDLRWPEQDYRNLNDESDEQVLDFGESGSEVQCVEMDNVTGAEGFNHAFRRARRGQKMRPRPSNTEIRGMSPNSSDIRRGRWDTNSEYLEPDRRGLYRRERDQRPRSQTRGREGRGPHQEGHGTCEGPPAPFRRPVGPSPSREVKSFHDFEGLQNQEAVQPQKHRGALLPTPSECPLSLSNTVMKSHEGSSIKTPQFCPPFNRDRGTGRGRGVANRFRGRARAQGRGGPPR